MIMFVLLGNILCVTNYVCETWKLIVYLFSVSFYYCNKQKCKRERKFLFTVGLDLPFWRISAKEFKEQQRKDVRTVSHNVSRMNKNSVKWDIEAIHHLVRILVIKFKNFATYLIEVTKLEFVCVTYASVKWVKPCNFIFLSSSETFETALHFNIACCRLL